MLAACIVAVPGMNFLRVDSCSAASSQPQFDPIRKGYLVTFRSRLLHKLAIAFGLNEGHTLSHPYHMKPDHHEASLFARGAGSRCRLVGAERSIHVPFVV